MSLKGRGGGEAEIKTRECAFMLQMFEPSAFCVISVYQLSAIDTVSNLSIYKYLSFFNRLGT